MQTSSLTHASEYRNLSVPIVTEIFKPIEFLITRFRVGADEMQDTAFPRVINADLSCMLDLKIRNA